jgi:hypothetical protein
MFKIQPATKADLLMFYFFFYFWRCWLYSLQGDTEINKTRITFLLAPSFRKATTPTDNERKTGKFTDFRRFAMIVILI